MFSWQVLGQSVTSPPWPELCVNPKSEVSNAGTSAVLSLSLSGSFWSSYRCMILTTMRYNKKADFAGGQFFKNESGTARSCVWTTHNYLIKMHQVSLQENTKQKHKRALSSSSVFLSRVQHLQTKDICPFILLSRTSSRVRSGVNLVPPIQSVPEFQKSSNHFLLAITTLTVEMEICLCRSHEPTSNCVTAA